MPNPPCAVPTCDRPSAGRSPDGYCLGHHNRLVKFGDTFPDVAFKDLLPKCPVCDEILAGPTVTWGDWTPFPTRMHPSCRTHLEERLNSFDWMDPDDDEEATSDTTNPHPDPTTFDVDPAPGSGRSSDDGPAAQPAGAPIIRRATRRGPEFHRRRPAQHDP